MGTDDPTGLDPVLQLTAIVLLLRPLDVWWITPIVLALAILVLLFTSLRRSPATWTGVAVLLALRIVVVWPLADNHIYLLAYWCLALGVGLASPAPGPTVATAGRWLLGAAFGFAVIWKLALAPDFLDGRFFRVTLLTDDRFADAVMLLTGLTPGDIAAARRYLVPLPSGAELIDAGTLIEPFRFSALVAVATGGVLALEIAVAVACLLPAVGFIQILQHGAILAFCGITYAFAPVAGFGWLIAIIGHAMCRPEQRALRAAYLVAFLLILQYSEMPWAGVLANWTSAAGS